MLSILMRWQIFERSWATDWIFVSFAVFSAVNFGSRAVARARLDAALSQGERCLSRAEVACVALAVERARSLAPEHPRTQFLGLGSRLLLGEIDAVEGALFHVPLTGHSDDQSQAMRFCIEGDIDLARGRFDAARDRYLAASQLVQDSSLVNERFERLRLAEREVSAKRAAEIHRWRTDFDQMIEAVERNNAELASLRLTEFQLRIFEVRSVEVSRELRLAHSAVAQATSKQRMAQSVREIPTLPEPPRSSALRSAAEERRLREVEEARERERERRRQQAAITARAVDEALSHAREFFEKGMALLDAPAAPRAP